MLRICFSGGVGSPSRRVWKFRRRGSHSHKQKSRALTPRVQYRSVSQSRSYTVASVTNSSGALIATVAVERDRRGTTSDAFTPPGSAEHHWTGHDLTWCDAEEAPPAWRIAEEMQKRFPRLLVAVASFWDSTVPASSEALLAGLRENAMPLLGAECSVSLLAEVQATDGEDALKKAAGL